MAVTEEDTRWLKETEKFRLSIELKPCHSDFRVTATVVYVDKLTQEVKSIHGTNNEPCWIGGSICAERCALVAMRAQHRNEKNTQVKAVYITSDSDNILTPGVMCREFMYSLQTFTPEVSIVMGNAGLSQTYKQTIGGLYPYPFVFARKSRPESLALQDEQDKSLPVPAQGTDECLVYTKALDLAKKVMEKTKGTKDWNESDRLKCAACALMTDGTVFLATEKRFLEYANSLDAITQLAESLQNHISTNVEAKLKLVCQVDASGLAHAPFAPGRAFLFEYGHQDGSVICHTLQTDQEEVKLNVVKIAALMPSCPILKDVQ